MYNNLFVFLEPVDEPRPTYDCGQLIDLSTVSIKITQIGKSVTTIATTNNFLGFSSVPF